MLVYFAHPIDQAQGSNAGFIKRIAAALSVSFYRPGGAFSLGKAATHEDRAGVQFINEMALFKCDALLAALPAGVPTLGVPAEIEAALRFNKPTVIVTDNGTLERSVQIQAWRDKGAFVFHGGDDLSGQAIVAALKTRPDPLLGEIPSDELLVRYDNPAKPTMSRGKYDGDAGVDLAVSIDTGLKPGEYALLPTGAHAAIPPGMFGWITGRSSTWAKYRCDVRTAIIDSGYRGELMIGVENRGETEVVFEAGTRLGQLVLLPAFDGPMRVVDELPESERGEAGYGSSGH